MKPPRSKIRLALRLIESCSLGWKRSRGLWLGHSAFVGKLSEIRSGQKRFGRSCSVLAYPKCMPEQYNHFVGRHRGIAAVWPGTMCCNWAMCWSIGESQLRENCRFDSSEWNCQTRVSFGFVWTTTAVTGFSWELVATAARFGFSHANKMQANRHKCWCGQHDIVIGRVFISISIIQIRLAIRTWSSTLCIRGQFVWTKCNRMEVEWFEGGKRLLWLPLEFTVFSLFSLFMMKYAT